MRSTPIFVAVAVPMLAFAQSGDDTAGETQTPWSEFASTVAVSSYLTEVYGTGAVPTAATGAAATSLASAMYSLREQLMTDSAYIEAANTVYMAMASASNGEALVSSADGVGFFTGDYTTADWWKSGVPTSAKSEFATMLASFKAVETSVLGGDVTLPAPTTRASATSTATETSTSVSKAGAPRSMVTGGAVVGFAAVVAAAMA